MRLVGCDGSSHRNRCWVACSGPLQGGRAPPPPASLALALLALFPVPRAPPTAPSPCLRNFPFYGPAQRSPGFSQPPRTLTPGCQPLKAIPRQSAHRLPTMPPNMPLSPPPKPSGATLPISLGIKKPLSFLPPNLWTQPTAPSSPGVLGPFRQPFPELFAQVGR